MRHTVGLIAALLQDGIDRGSLPPQPVQALTHVLVGAVDDTSGVTRMMTLQSGVMRGVTSSSTPMLR